MIPSEPGGATTPADKPFSGTAVVDTPFPQSLFATVRVARLTLQTRELWLGGSLSRPTETQASRLLALLFMFCFFFVCVSFHLFSHKKNIKEIKQIKKEKKKNLKSKNQEIKKKKEKSLKSNTTYTLNPKGRTPPLRRLTCASLLYFICPQSLLPVDCGLTKCSI